MEKNFEEKHIRGKKKRRQETTNVATKEGITAADARRGVTDAAAASPPSVAEIPLNDSTTETAAAVKAKYDEGTAAHCRSQNEKRDDECSRRMRHGGSRSHRSRCDGMDRSRAAMWQE